ncbi:MAG: 50S ribosomal protein L9 [Sorangiineae bacterium]|nr:50S ribosomal protein L9 [Polyangiaceae bacterium]MEB2322122.1 50S ribosomal protein L9 [Sorangiineae bacterium]
MASAIRVVLQQSVENLGSGGDVVRVRPGYARNFLIPRGLAAPATPANLARVNELKRVAAAHAQAELDAAKSLGEKLASMAVKLERAVGEENKMYGSVTTRDIEEAYAAQGVELDRRKVHLHEPIKQLGLHEVPIRLHADVTVNLRVEVVKKA